MSTETNADSRTTRTESTEGRSLTASGGWLTPSTLAARSMRAVERTTDPEERRVAFTRHMAQFPPLIGRL